MAEIAKGVSDCDAQDLYSLLSSLTRDFLVRNDGEQVKIESLIGKTVGLYFAAAWSEPCQLFTTQLAEVYDELSPTAGFEIVFISGDDNEEIFSDFFTKMPWLAIPFTDSETRDRLNQLFEIKVIPNLVIVDDHGKFVNEDKADVIRSYGADAYPYTPERMNEINEEEETARREQTLKSVLVSPSRDFVFSQEEIRDSTVFTAKLVEVYTKLKESGEDFEIVLISLEIDEESFKKDFQAKPWLALPFNVKDASKLSRHFMVSMVPMLVILGPDGKTRHPDVVEAIDDYGILAYPFTPEKFEELKEIEKAKAEAQTLESLLVSGDLNYVLGKDGAKVLVSDLVGKNILFYFSAHSCPPCDSFTPTLVEVYKQIKEHEVLFEMIFISNDEDQQSFDECYSHMPWLALPFGDPRKPYLSRTFEVDGIPTLAAVGPTGKTITKDAMVIVNAHGADAYPFTEERLKEIIAKYHEMKKEWPEKVKHPQHGEHELQRTRVQAYICDKCIEGGQILSYQCEECQLNLHPGCALKAERKQQ